MRRKTALVLSGGGFKGAYQRGALEGIQKFWEKNNDWKEITGKDEMEFDIIAGISTGALSGLFVAQNNLGGLIKYWKDVKDKGSSVIFKSKILDAINSKRKFKIFFQIVSAIAKFKKLKSIADNTPLRGIVSNFAKISKIKSTFICGYVSLDDGEYHSNRHDEYLSDEDFCNAIMASTTMPVVWEPVKSIKTKKGTSYNNVDGGLRSVSPLGDVIRQINKEREKDKAEGREESIYTIIILSCHSEKLKNKPFSEENIVGIASRSLTEITLSEIFRDDVKEFLDKNAIIKQVDTEFKNNNIDFDIRNIVDSKGKSLNYFNAIVIQPENNLGDPLSIKPEKIEERIKKGEEDAKVTLTKHVKKVKNTFKQFDEEVNDLTNLDYKITTVTQDLI